VSHAVHERLASILHAELGWALNVEAEDETGVRASFPVPGRQRHYLRFRCEPGSVEIGYDDALPPGPAERLWVFDPDQAGDALREGVMTFLHDLIGEDIIVVREPLSRVTRLLRGFDCSSLPRFYHRDETPPDVLEGAASVYSWNRTYDRT
jgi:hypothetical protein